MKTYIGIDNGVSGAMAVITPDFTFVQPLVSNQEHGGKVVCAVRLYDEFVQLAGRYELTVVAEAAQKFTPGRLAFASVWFSWGAIVAAARLARVRFTAVDPRRWQKEMFKGLPKSLDTKQASVQKARELFPTVSLRTTERCSTDNHNFADALLLAEWGRRNNL